MQEIIFQAIDNNVNSGEKTAMFKLGVSTRVQHIIKNSEKTSHKKLYGGFF